MKKLVGQYAGLIGLAGLVILVDQWSKWQLRSHLMIGQSLSLGGFLGDFIQIVRTHNTGAAFSMGSGLNPVFVVLAIVASLAMLYYASRLPADARLMWISLGLLLGGTLGNLIDRLREGQVTDFIAVRYFAVINVADMCITVGGVLFVLSLLLQDKKEKAPTA